MISKLSSKARIRGGFAAVCAVLIILKLILGGLPLLIAIGAVLVAWFIHERWVNGVVGLRYVKWYVLAFAVWFLIFDVVLAQFYVSFSPFRIPHHFYHHGISASSRMNDPWGNLNAEVFTNDWGMKDEKIRKIDRRFDGYRILTLGDSFTEGQGYRYEQTFPGIFQRLASQAGLPLEILDGGVASHTARLYYLHLKYLLDVAKLHVDELWVFPDISDAQDEAIYLEFWPDREDTVTYFARKWHAFLYHNSFVYGNFLRATYGDDVNQAVAGVVRWLSGLFPSWFVVEETPEAYAGLKRPQGIDQAVARLAPTYGKTDSSTDWSSKKFWPKGYLVERYTWIDDPEVRKRWGDDGLVIAKAYMRLLIGLARERGIRVSMGIYPGAMNIGMDTRFYEGEWTRFAHEQGVPLLNLFEPFQALRGTRDEILRDYYIPGDVHWNDRGHRLVAETWFRTWCGRDDAVTKPGSCRLVAARPK